MKIELKPFQAEFLKTQARYPALKASIGTGKTLMLLLKAWQFCEQYPDSLVLIVRKEFTDLRDSTMKDFERYFNVKVDGDKEYHFANKSVIMFRHGAELNVLKNLNLSWIGIEQAEEFETEETFDFLRDRLRRDNAPYRQLCLIANARGHNWIWKRFIQGSKVETLDAQTGQHVYFNGEYLCSTANTFANEDNLPSDFIADLKRMETEAPNHYKQYVLNSDEEVEEDDFVFNFSELEESRKREYFKREGYGLRLAGFDIARYGNDKCAGVCIQQMGALIWKTLPPEQWEKKDLDYTTGRIISIVAQLGSTGNIIDEDGIGAGPLDTINAKLPPDKQYKGFRNPNLSYSDNAFYGNKRTLNAFKLKELISKGHIAITDEELIQELMTLRYKYMNDGRKILISKEEMRKKGFKSPNLADALIMAVSLIGDVKEQQDNQYHSQPRYSREESLFN